MFLIREIILFFFEDDFERSTEKTDVNRNIIIEKAKIDMLIIVRLPIMKHQERLWISNVIKTSNQKKKQVV